MARELTMHYLIAMLFEHIKLEVTKYQSYEMITLKKRPFDNSENY